jgi:hypothetical protein
VPIAVVRDLSAPQPTTPRHNRQQQQQHNTAAAGRAASVRNTTAAGSRTSAYQQQHQQSFGSCATGGGYGAGCYSNVGYTTSAMTSPEGDSAYYAKVAAAQQQAQAQRSQQHNHQQTPLQQGQVSTLLIAIIIFSQIESELSESCSSVIVRLVYTNSIACSGSAARCR